MFRENRLSRKQVSAISLAVAMSLGTARAWADNIVTVNGMPTGLYNVSTNGGTATAVASGTQSINTATANGGTGGSWDPSVSSPPYTQTGAVGGNGGTAVAEGVTTYAGPGSASATAITNYNTSTFTPNGQGAGGNGDSNNSASGTGGKGGNGGIAAGSAVLMPTGDITLGTLTLAVIGGSGGVGGNDTNTDGIGGGGGNGGNAGGTGYFMGNLTAGPIILNDIVQAGNGGQAGNGDGLGQDHIAENL